MNNKSKSVLHHNNPHEGRYNFTELLIASPDLKEYIKPNPAGDDTIDFSDSKAVLLLNKALLKHFYNIDYWEIPQGFLCPPIPGRADYIHYAADLFRDGKRDLKVLDIGTGANCIYPIIGSQSYNWDFVATDIDKNSIANAKKIVESNQNLKDKVEIVLQENRSVIFTGIIKEGDYFDLTVCNPPFHASEREAIESNRKKIANLNRHRTVQSPDNLNFGGQKAELWCPGGEMFFLKKLIKESAKFKDQVTWFTSLVSKNENVRPLRHYIRKQGATRVKIKEMSQGSKISRLIAWTFCKEI
ncbi:MAG: 23S rRNA (adenine(1618)-N(6))-methyltransferase RlmF [Spirochaetaceae bacterium]